METYTTFLRFIDLGPAEGQPEPMEDLPRTVNLGEFCDNEECEEAINAADDYMVVPNYWFYSDDNDVWTSENTYTYVGDEERFGYFEAGFGTEE